MSVQEFRSYIGTVHSSITGSSGDYLATSISLNFESDRVALSTSNVSNYTGRVEIHDYSASYWVKIFSLSGPDGEYSSFGHEISLNWSGTRLAVSSYQKNKVYIYDATGTGSNVWASYVSNTLNTSSLSLSVGAEFGYSISLAQDEGNRIAVGAPGENKVYVYEYDSVNSNWGSGPVWSIGDTGMKNLVAKTLDADTGLATAYLHAHNVSNRFGHKVRLSAFGNYLIVGAPGTIATIDSSSAYDPHTSENPYSGTVYTNQRQIGHVRCFMNDTTTWASGTTQYGQDILGKAGTVVGTGSQPAFGTSCDISTNGNKIIVSSPYKKVSTLSDAGQIDTYLINDDLDTWLSVSTSIAGSKSSQKLGMNLRLDFAGERLVTGDLSTSNQESSYYGGISLYALDFGTDRWYDITPPIQLHDWPTLGSTDFNPVDITNGKILAISDPKGPPASQQSLVGNSGKVVFYQFPLTNAFQGNTSVGGYVKCENLYVGANDNSSNTDHLIPNKRISFGGTIRDNSYEETYIENRSVDGAGKSELLLYKRNDIWDKAGGGAHSTNPSDMVDDSIRIKAAEICLDYEDTNLHGTYPNAATRNTRFLLNRSGQIAVGNAFYNGKFDVVSDFDVNDKSYFWTTVNIGNKTNKPLNTTPTLNTNNERMFIGLNAQTATPIGIDGKNGTQQFERYNLSSQAWDPDEFAFYFSDSDATIYENTHPGNWHGNSGQFSCWLKLNDTQSNCAGVLAWFGEDHHREDPANTNSANWTEYKGGWLKLTSTGLQYEFEHNSANVQSISYTFKQNVWYHIAGNFPSENTYPGAYSGKSWPKIFIDGVEETLSSYPGSAYIGGTHNGGWDRAQYGFGSAFTYSRNNNSNPDLHPDDINYSNEIAIISGSKNNGIKNCWIALMDIGNGNTNTNLSKIMPGEMLTVGGICTITKYLGVGVPLPKYQIDVNGDINFTGNIYQNSNLFGGGSSLWTQSSSNIYYNSGNVGIGTVSPTYDIDVVGDINFTGNIYQNSNLFSGGSSLWTQSSSNIYYNSGNVGIGTSSPAYKLDIAGTIGIDALISSHIDNDIILFDDQKSTTTFTGTLYGGATRDADDNYIKLAFDLSQNHTVSWPIHLPNYWTCEFDWFATTTGADETQFIFYATAPITSVLAVDNSSSTAGGFMVVFEFYGSDRIVIKNNLGTIVASSDVTFTSNSYYKVVITFNRGYLSVSLTLNSSILQLNHDFGEMSQAYTTGKYMGFGGRTGGVSSHQRIRKIKVTKGCPFVHQNNNLSYMNGNLGIGTTSPAYTLDVNGNINYTGSISNISDDRLKENETRIENALLTICKLDPQIYDKRSDLESNVFTYEAGLIAQDIYYDVSELRYLVHVPSDATPSETKPESGSDIQVDPDYSDWGTTPASVNYIGLIPYLIKSIKELKDENDALKARVTALES